MDDGVSGGKLSPRLPPSEPDSYHGSAVVHASSNGMKGAD